MDLVQIISFIIFLQIARNRAEAQGLGASPCPRIFVYEDNSPEPDRWYGLVTLLSDFDLSGVFLRLMFDKPSLELGNWFSKAYALNGNTEYAIRHPDFLLKAHVPQIIRFYVKFRTGESPPKLVGFTLDGRTMCPEKATAVNTVFTSESRERPFRLGGGFNTGSSRFEQDDDIVSNPVSRLGPPQNSSTIDVNEICGTIVHPQPQIPETQPTSKRDFPWHAAMYHITPINYQYWCAGSLVSMHHVITVAHGVTKQGTNALRNADNFVIHLGKYYLKRFNRGVQMRQVAKMVAHPDFDWKKLSNDIAIIKLAKPVEITEYVRPVCLWQDSADLNSIINKQGSVVGWGPEENGEFGSQLMLTQMPVKSIETCTDSLPTLYPRLMLNRTYCAGFETGTSVCIGDSGGGMVFARRRSGSRKVTWQLRGLVSLSADSKNHYKCDSSHYVIFTDTAKYLDWIKQVMR